MTGDNSFLETTQPVPLFSLDHAPAGADSSRKLFKHACNLPWTAWSEA